MRNILFTLLIFCLASCQSKRAVQLHTVLSNSERAVFNIMVGKNGPNERKHHCIIDGDFKCALQAVDDKERAFNTVINKINAVETNDIKYGNDLKKAAISYYNALKQFEISDRQEIALQQLSHDKTNTAQVRDSAMAKQLQLLNKKQEMRQLIDKKESQLAEIQKQFNSVNHLD
ncbi:hypothetical protein SAMN04488511_10616 [Pedobacter suwonensis]|uniref:Uncharacterized protein n=1 Tax=Pedobacter suwonensis TaxID=332999 RepID=A0A1I0T4C3_9SPHI|nr:hypothetical protein [Pedobacter suwonensis]SFA46599.1 hypothetical protein SAMN04488511_10616 [Pedobacter suwonensis]